MRAASLNQLLEELGTKPDRVTVEHNGKILEREEFGSVALADGDAVKVLYFLGGDAGGSGCGAGG